MEKEKVEEEEEGRGTESEREEGQIEDNERRVHKKQKCGKVRIFRSRFRDR